MPTPLHKIIITGTGRAGTTFLVRLLTELGLDTGYTRDNWRRDYFEHCNAGLERDITADDAPYIIKSPSLCESLRGVLASGRIVIDHALIPIRDLTAATASRIRVGGANGSVPGGLLSTSNPAHQKAVLAEMFHQLALTLATYQIPHTFLVFPRFVQDAEYAFGELHSVLGNVDRAKFDDAFYRIAKPALVHTFSATSQPAGPDTASFEAARRRKRLWRRTRRLVAWSAVAASIALNISVFRPKAVEVNLSHVITPRTPEPTAPHKSLISTTNFRIPLKFAYPVDVSIIWMQTSLPYSTQASLPSPTQDIRLPKAAVPITPQLHEPSAFTENPVRAVLVTGSE